LPPTPTLFPYTTLFRSDLRSVAELEMVGLAAAAVRQDGAVLERAARQAEIEPAALETVVNLAVWPLLQACGRQLQTHIPSAWSRSEEHMSELQSRGHLV